MGGHLVQPDGQGRVCHEVKIRTSSSWLLKASKDSNCRVPQGSLCWWFIYLLSGGVLTIPRGIFCFSLSVISAFCCPPEGRAWHHFLHMAEEDRQAAVKDTMVLPPPTKVAPIHLPTGIPRPNMVSRCGWRWVTTYLRLLALFQGGCCCCCCQGLPFQPTAP